jgi:hypothetical protein
MALHPKASSRSVRESQQASLGLSASAKAVALTSRASVFLLHPILAGILLKESERLGWFCQGKDDGKALEILLKTRNEGLIK